MRCFFMKGGRICSVSYLSGQNDEELIAEALQLFKSQGLADGAEGFEVWDHTRFIYRFVVDEAAERQTITDGLKGPPGILERIIQRLKPKIFDFDVASLPAGG